MHLKFEHTHFSPLSTPLPNPHNNQCPSCAYIYLHVLKACDLLTPKLNAKVLGTSAIILPTNMTLEQSQQPYTIGHSLGWGSHNFLKPKLLKNNLEIF
jgi:hypothetical protein